MAMGARRPYAGGLLLLWLGFVLTMLGACSSDDSPGDTTGAPTTTDTASATAKAPPQSSSPRDATYVIEGKAVTLANGIAEVEAAPGSAAKVTTRYFGNEASGDVNGDGQADVGFILTQSSGGSGTFYYAVVALKTGSGYAGTNAVLLGDRIAPQTSEVRDGRFIVNYADRKPGEPMTASPSVGVSKYLVVVGGRLQEP